MDSVIQREKCCYVCYTTKDLEAHHVYFGFDGDRELSEKWGMKVWLCARHHRDNRYGVHFNKDFERSLKETAQRIFEVRFPDEDFVEIFGRNYIDEELEKERIKEWNKTHKKKKTGWSRYR